MRAIPRNRPARLLAAGALSLALWTAGAVGTASAAAFPPRPAATQPAGEVSVKANPTDVKTGDKVTFTGRTKGVPIGSKVVLQHENGSKWTTLHASTAVKQGSSYSLDTTFRSKGKEQLRVMVAGATSPTVTVNVS
ncbi:hypothetical protein ACIGQE_20140 [Streptomyces sp. NPDC053429]|uniref:hypothetical protein n=1 Tax=Streptomyces sp. NPDC053429 TaxID=3365702 RepID=UPI0037D15517